MAHRVLPFLASLSFACSLPPASDDVDPADPVDEAFASGKADGGCLSADVAVQEGVLALVNDPAIDVEILDAPTSEGGAGLYHNAAVNIVDARPLETLEELDAVPYVGQGTCRALAEFACNHLERCMGQWVAMTWNLEHFPLGDHAVEGATMGIDQIAPDLLGVQEIEDIAAFTAMDDALPEYEGFLGETGPDSRVGVFVRSSRVEVIDLEHVFADDGWAFPRPVLALTVRLIGTREPVELTFAVVHLKAMTDSTSEGRRRKAIKKLRTWIDARRAAGAPRVLILGDFNDRLTDVGMANVFVPLTEASAGMEALTLPAAQAGEFTLVPYKNMIDHVFVTDELTEVATPTETEVLHLDETWPEYIDTVTDHRPVLSYFDVAVGY